MARPFKRILHLRVPPPFAFSAKAGVFLVAARFFAKKRSHSSTPAARLASRYQRPHARLRSECRGRRARIAHSLARGSGAFPVCARWRSAKLVVKSQPDLCSMQFHWRKQNELPAHVQESRRIRDGRAGAGPHRPQPLKPLSAMKPS